MLAHAGELFAEHWQELTTHKDLMVLKPDEQRYRHLEAAGVMIIHAAWLGTELVGYCVSFLTNHLHYADLRVCSNDILFVAAAHRGGRLGIRLINAMEAAARDAGASLMLWHAKPATALATLLPLRRYAVQDVIFSRDL